MSAAVSLLSFKTAVQVQIFISPYIVASQATIQPNQTHLTDCRFSPKRTNKLILNVSDLFVLPMFDAPPQFCHSGVPKTSGRKLDLTKYRQQVISLCSD